MAPENTVKAAKNFPKTMDDRDTGEVRSSCSVFVFLSSLKDFIVKRGKITAENKSINVKYVVTSPDIE